MKTVKSLYPNLNISTKIGIMGFLTALIGVVAPMQLFRLYINETFSGTAYDGLAGMFMIPAIFAVTAFPISIILQIIGFRFIYKIFKQYGTKNFNLFLIFSFLIFLVIYPVSTSSDISLWFGYRSLYIFPLVLILNYLVFGKLNLSTKYLGKTAMSVSL